MEQKTFSVSDYIPMSHWGKDHWSTLGYVEVIMVECGGFQVGTDPRMKSSRRNFRVMAQGCPHPKRPTLGSAFAYAMELTQSTKLNDGQVVSGHDDWACVQDMAAEGLFQQGPDAVEPGTVLTLSEKGVAIVNALREFKRNQGQYGQFRWPDVLAVTPAAVEASA
jgi:hypothetical protein